MWRLAEKAEEYGITIQLVIERGTSSRCPRCRIRELLGEASCSSVRDVDWKLIEMWSGAMNIGLALSSVKGEVINRTVTCPTLVDSSG